MASQCYARTLSACSEVLVRRVWECHSDMCSCVGLQHPRSGISGDFMGFSDNESESEASDAEVGDKKKDSISSNVSVHAAVLVVVIAVIMKMTAMNNFCFVMILVWCSFPCSETSAELLQQHSVWGAAAGGPQ